MESFQSILTDAFSNIEIEKSKFISYAIPIETEEEADDFINSIKKKHYDATHNVTAYLLRVDNNLRRYSDDGEPSGTAGMPTLTVIQNRGLVDLCIVTTRYFGGTKLGAGGLVRAYAESANQCLNQAKIIDYYKMTRYTIEVSYDLLSSVQYLIKNKGILTSNIEYIENVTISIYLKNGDKDFLLDLTNMSSSRIIIQEKETKYIAYEDNEILSIKELI